MLPKEMLQGLSLFVGGGGSWQDFWGKRPKSRKNPAILSFGGQAERGEGVAGGSDEHGQGGIIKCSCTFCPNQHCTLKQVELFTTVF